MVLGLADYASLYCRREWIICCAASRPLPIHWDFLTFLVYGLKQVYQRISASNRYTTGHSRGLLNAHKNTDFACDFWHPTSTGNDHRQGLTTTPHCFVVTPSAKIGVSHANNLYLFDAQNPRVYRYVLSTQVGPHLFETKIVPVFGHIGTCRTCLGHLRETTEAVGRDASNRLFPSPLFFSLLFNVSRFGKAPVGHRTEEHLKHDEHIRTQTMKNTAHYCRYTNVLCSRDTTSRQ